MRGPSIAAAIGALALAACGGDDADQIADVIEQAATVDDPAHCTDLLTPAFLEQTESPDDPLASCQQSQAEGGDAADAVEISNLEVDGDSASAEVAFTGGPSDGQAVALELVKEGEDWKLDRVASFVTFDREAYLAAFAAAFESEPDPSPGLARCGLDAVAALDDDEIQELALSGNQVGSVVAGACPAEYREAVMARLEESAQALNPAVQDCIRRALGGLSDGRFSALTLGTDGEALQQFIDASCAPAAGAS